MDYKKTTLNKENWLVLAKLAIEENSYIDDLDDAIRKVCKEHEHATDFIGTPYDATHVLTVIVGLLGSEFEYLLWDCNADLEQYNKNITFEDGSHPNIKTLEEFYEMEVVCGR